MVGKLQPGDRVLIEIRSSEVYEGNIEYISTKSIELYNIFCQTTSTAYDGSMTFYRDEVVTVARITDKPNVESSTNGESFESSKKITLHPDEFNRLRQMTFDVIFVDKFDKRFQDAVDVLSNRESIAVVGLGSTFARGRGLSLLLMSDFKQIYIFDLLNLVYLKSLANILESTFITKVVHDGSVLYDCLYHRYEVEMKNVFDTKLIHRRISSSTSQDSPVDVEWNISQCLTYHFNFPPSLLAAAIDDVDDKTWGERPVVKSDKVKAAQLVVYLLTLRDKLMSQILKPYNDVIENEYSKFHKLTNADLLKFNNSTSS